jgi:hypothetical protein
VEGDSSPDDPGSQAQILAGDRKMRGLQFEFLRAREAFVVKVDHNGSSDELFVDCRTKVGGPIGKADLTFRYESLVIALVLVVVGLISGTLVLLFTPAGEQFASASSIPNRIDIFMPAAAVGLISVLIFGIALSVVAMLIEKIFTTLGRYKIKPMKPADAAWQQIRAARNQ